MRNTVQKGCMQALDVFQHWIMYMLASINWPSRSTGVWKCMKWAKVGMIFSESVCWQEEEREVGVGSMYVCVRGWRESSPTRTASTEWLRLAHCICHHWNPSDILGTACWPAVAPWNQALHPHLSRSQHTKLTTDLMDRAEKQLLLYKELEWKTAGGSRSHWWPYQTWQTQCRNYPSLKHCLFPRPFIITEEKRHLTAAFIIIVFRVYWVICIYLWYFVYFNRMTVSAQVFKSFTPVKVTILHTIQVQARKCTCGIKSKKHLLQYLKWYDILLYYWIFFMH